jgi:hypothetical protein
MQDGRRGALATLLLAGLFALVLGPWTPVQGTPDERATKKKMESWCRDLGVKCSYCHVQRENRRYDYKAITPHKAIAHYCEENFVGKLELKGGRPISCADCHQHRTTFLPRPDEDGKMGQPGSGQGQGQGGQGQGGEAGPGSGSGQGAGPGHGGGDDDDDDDEGHEGHEGHR